MLQELVQIKVGRHPRQGMHVALLLRERDRWLHACHSHVWVHAGPRGVHIVSWLQLASEMPCARMSACMAAHCRTLDLRQGGGDLWGRTQTLGTATHIHRHRHRYKPTRKTWSQPEVRQRDFPEKHQPRQRVATVLASSRRSPHAPFPPRHREHSMRRCHCRRCRPAPPLQR